MFSMIPLEVRLPWSDWRRRLVDLLGLIPNPKRQYIVIGHDVLVAYASFVAAIVMRLGEFPTGGDGPSTAHLFMPLFLVMFVALSWYYRLHLRMWRFSSLADIVSIVRLVAVCVATYYLFLFAAYRLEGVPRSVPFIHGLLLVFMLGSSRAAYRMLRDDALSSLFARGDAGNSATPVLLLGTEAGASIFLRGLQTQGIQLYRAVGIISTDGGGVGRQLHHVPVLGALMDLENIVESLAHTGSRPARLVVTSRLDPALMEDLVERSANLRLLLCRTPDPSELRDGAGAPRAPLRPVAIEDLLPRPQVVLDDIAINSLIYGKRVLVTGAGGSIGSELVRQLAKRKPSTLLLLDQNEFNLYLIDQEISETYPKQARQAIIGDVRQDDRVKSIFLEHRPEIVFHAAALKHVPLVEANPSEGILTNAIGTSNVANAVLACGASAMILISTDKAVNPTNVMGASKRLAEFYCQALDMEQAEQMGDKPHPRFMTVRFGNVLGSSGSVVPLFQRQLERGGPLTITHPDITRYFMTIPEAVSLVLHASAYGLRAESERGRIFVLDMGPPVKVIDVARRMIGLAGLDPADVKIKITGLRPGEKLFEELFDQDESQHKKINGTGVFSTFPSPLPFDVLSDVFLRLRRADSDESRLTSLLSVVPGYVREGSMISGPRPDANKSGMRQE